MNSLARQLSFARPVAAQKTGDDLAELGGYEVVRIFERRTDRRTVVVTAVSAKRMDDRVMFRIATFRESMGKDGVLRRSPWLGQREVVHKIDLEQEAMSFIIGETARSRKPSLTFSE